MIQFQKIKGLKNNTEKVSHKTEVKVKQWEKLKRKRKEKKKKKKLLAIGQE